MENKQVHINEKIRLLVNTVIQRCKKESLIKTVHGSLDDYIGRASYYTGLSQYYIGQVIQNEYKEENNRKEIDIDTHIAILKCIKKCYSQNLLPCLKTMYSELKSEFSDLPNYTHFEIEMVKSGFMYRSTNRGLLLLEDPKMRFERFLYLKTIQRFREKNIRIYYIDERVIDKSCTFERCTADTMKGWSADLNKFILFHAVNNDSYTAGMFCAYVSIDDFKKWISDVLVNIIKPPSIIVLSRSSVHDHLVSNTVTGFDSKDTMLKWLQENNIPADASMHKAELFELIKRSPKSVYTGNGVDRILKAYGHQVLYLPSKYGDLSPITLLWKHIRNEIHKTIDVNDQNITLLSIKESVTKIIKNIMTPKWLQFDSAIKKLEIQLLDMDIEIENLLDAYVTQDVSDINLPVERFLV